VGRLFHIIKSIFFWSYARNTWQWDVLCVAILAFIFLTPKSWFETSELRRTEAHQKGFATTLLVSRQSLSAQADKAEIERLVRASTGRPDAEVKGVREVRDSNGQVVAFEVDIR